LALDLNSIPPLSSPAPPSNTLLITRLDDPHIFHPASLATIRQHINEIAPLNSFSPLKSFNRIICSFYDIESAVRIRQEFDGAAFLGHTIARCYFGEPTPIGDEKKYLERPDAGRLFFISPPPSPPVGWEMRHEDPPNKEVHADDLAMKLAKLTGKMGGDTTDGEDDVKMLYTKDELHKLKTSRPALAANDEQSPARLSPNVGGRSRSSTLIYDPKAHGDSPGLPAVMLETEDDSEVELSVPEKKIIAHTSRPPIELMADLQS
jgi:Calcipressin